MYRFTEGILVGLAVGSMLGAYVLYNNAAKGGALLDEIKRKAEEYKSKMAARLRK